MTSFFLCLSVPDNGDYNGETMSAFYPDQNVGTIRGCKGNEPFAHRKKFLSTGKTAKSQPRKTKHNLVNKIEPSAYSLLTAGSVLGILSQQALYAVLPLCMGFGLHLYADKQRQHRMQQMQNYIVTQLEQTQSLLQMKYATHVEVGEIARQVKTVQVDTAQVKSKLDEHQQFITDLDASAEALHDNTRILPELVEKFNYLEKRVDGISQIHISSVSTKSDGAKQLCTRINGSVQERVAIFIDHANLEYSARDLNIKIDYAKLRSRLIENAQVIGAWIYMGVNPEDFRQRNFLFRLQKIGYEIVGKKIHYREDGSMEANVDIDLAVDMVSMISGEAVFDTAILVSGDGDYIPAVEKLRQKGVKVRVVSLRPCTSSALIAMVDDYMDLEGIKDNISWN
jgi:uncharacterized LabA/DUF88 family protein